MLISAVVLSCVPEKRVQINVESGTITDDPISRRSGEKLGEKVTGSTCSPSDDELEALPEASSSRTRA